jgi:hypothetical protein
MVKTTIGVLLVSLALASVHLAGAQQPKKVPRIGVFFPPARLQHLNWSRRFDKAYANMGTWRNSTSRLSLGTLKVISNVSQVSLLNLSALRRT